ncbi:major royal jelly family protein [Photobacterium sagamiensis]
MVVDAKRGWIYLADINNPSLLAVRISDGYTRRFEGHYSLQAEKGAAMTVGGEQTYFFGAPMEVGVNPITLSANGDTIFFGAMTGNHWYSAPTELLREGSDEQLAAAIKLEGHKPESDGASTDRAGNHYFTNSNDNGVDVLTKEGQLMPLVRDERISWPDSVQFGEGGWLYISVNQLNMTDAFTGKGDLGTKPYRIMRVWTGAEGGNRL